MPTVRLTTILSILLALAFALPATAFARGQAVTRHTPVTPGSRYLALGDSVTFSYQESAVVPAPNYAQPSSFLGYPEQLGTELHLKVTNIACPGETSSSLINASATSFGCENAYRKAYPLQVHYNGSQLAYAVSFLRSHKNVRLVSLMIGANDGFLCRATNADGCSSASEEAALAAKISHNVATILTAIRHHAHYRGQLVIVSYYSLDYASAVTTAASTLINTAMDTAAKPFGVEFANGFQEFQAASVRFANDPCLAGLLTQLGSYGNCGVHPSFAGQALLAQAVAAAIRL